MQFPPGIAYIDGHYVPIEQAKISVLDWGFLHSDATYDVVHVWKGRFFRLDTHIDRFTQSTARIHLSLPVAGDELARILAECVSRAKLHDAYVEMILTRGISPTFSRDPRDAVNQLICFAIPFVWILPPELRQEGLRLAVSKVQRIPVGSVDPRVKNYHWLDFVMGLFEALEKGAQNVVLGDGAGNLLEGPGFNIFAVKEGGLVTPDVGMLEGVTRQTIVELARELGVKVERRPLPATEAAAADELFATSTAGGIMPVTHLNDAPVAAGRVGPITARLMETYWAKHTDPEWSVSVESVLER